MPYMPPFVAPARFTDAAAALAQVQKIYQQALAHLRDSMLRFVAGEAEAAAQDDQSEEDVLALSTALDLPDLIEDEILMELPVAPRHDSCPVQVPFSAGDAQVARDGRAGDNPFAVLGTLRRTDH